MQQLFDTTSKLLRMLDEQYKLTLVITPSVTILSSPHFSTSNNKSLIIIVTTWFELSFIIPLHFSIIPV